MHAPLWVFGYGSLIWDPGFPVAERRIARLDGWHRSFCMRSIHHRGTVDHPGLVLALDRTEGATCTGVAFRVTPGAEAGTLTALRDRELVSSAYLETTLPVHTDTGAVDAVPAPTPGVVPCTRSLISNQVIQPLADGVELRIPANAKVTAMARDLAAARSIRISREV